MQASHILLIVNPVSGKMKTKTGLMEILDELYRADPAPAGEETPAPVVSSPLMPFPTAPAAPIGGDPVPGRRVTVCPTMFRGHARQLAARAFDEGFDTVVTCGGDGTLNETIGGLLEIPAENRPLLGYIPAGSTNDFAASIGLSSVLREAARTAVSDTEMPIDVGAFRPDDPDLPLRYFSYIASFGAFTAASYSTPQINKNLFGHVAYLLEGIKDLGNIVPRHAVVELDGGVRLEDDYVFGAVTNTTSAAGMVKLPADLVSMNDGLMEVLLIHHPRNINDLNKIVTALLSSSFENNPLIEFRHSATVRFHLSDRVNWSLDGEEGFGGNDLTVSCLHEAVKLKHDPL